MPTFWDSSFGVRSLEPVLTDTDGTSSPAAIASGASINIRVDDALAIIIAKDIAQSSNIIQIATSETAVGGSITPEAGSFTINLSTNRPTIEIPTDGKTYVILTNMEGANRDIQFILLKKPA